MWNLIKTGLDDVQSAFQIEGENLFQKYIEKEVLCDPDMIPLINKRSGVFDWRIETPLGGAGTLLNGAVLYALIRHFGMSRVIETGVAGGLYTSFLLAAVNRNKNGT